MNKTNLLIARSKTTLHMNNIEAALWGYFLGDAHAVPLHWYYSLPILHEHAQQIYNDPQFAHLHQISSTIRHPDSWKYFEKIVAEQEPAIHTSSMPQWKTPGTHYHMTVPRGGNSLTTIVGSKLIMSIAECKGYQVDDFLQRYVQLLMQPQQHHDFYIEGMHRAFCKNLSLGKNMHECGLQDETCLSGVVMSIPLMLYLCTSNEPEHRLQYIKQHTYLTHRSDEMVEMNQCMANMFFQLVSQQQDATLVLTETFHKLAGDNVPLQDLLASEAPMDSIFDDYFSIS